MRTSLTNLQNFACSLCQRNALFKYPFFLHGVLWNLSSSFVKLHGLFPPLRTGAGVMIVLLLINLFQCVEHSQLKDGCSENKWVSNCLLDIAAWLAHKHFKFYTVKTEYSSFPTMYSSPASNLNEDITILTAPPREFSFIPSQSPLYPVNQITNLSLITLVIFFTLFATIKTLLKMTVFSKLCSMPLIFA